MNKNDDHLTTNQWVQWSIATLIAAATLGIAFIAWSDDKFISKDVFNILNQRLDRIENKLDAALHIR